MEETILNKRNGKPFITRKGETYFIEGVEYTDDIAILLDAIANVKEVQYQDLHKRYATKEEHWRTKFNYQWGYDGAGLILWWNPTECWNEELTRRGELHCDKCGAKMVMYYRSYCPLCEGIKPEGEYYDYLKVAQYIEAKYTVLLRGEDDFWHFLVDLIDIRNDCLRAINWIDIKGETQEDWQRVICDYFIAEFGDNDHKFLFSW